MSDVVVFDVGGKKFSTTLKTLQRYPESFLPAMCKDCHDAVGTGKEIHVDRSPEGFTWIMEIYRGCPIKIGQSIPSNWGLTDMEDELNFYQLPTDQLLPSFHGETLFRREKEALKKLGDQILDSLKEDQKRLPFLPHVGFYVRGDRNKCETLNAVYLRESTNVRQVSRVFGLSSCTEVNTTGWDENGTMIFSGAPIMSLCDDHLKILTEHLSKFGFSVSQCHIHCGGQISDGSPRKIPILKVSWRKR